VKLLLRKGHHLSAALFPEYNWIRQDRSANLHSQKRTCGFKRSKVDEYKEVPALHICLKIIVTFTFTHLSHTTQYMTLLFTLCAMNAAALQVNDSHFKRHFFLLASPALN
jgi:hypothetical protein